MRSRIGRWIATAAILAGVALTSCAPAATVGPPITHVHSLSGVDGVELRTSGGLTITSGETQTLTITADSHIIHSLTSAVTDGTLILDAEGTRAGSGRIEYHPWPRLSRDHARLHPDDRHLASAAEQANAFLARSTKSSTPRARALAVTSETCRRGLVPFWSPYPQAGPTSTPPEATTG